eukprot:3808789-Prymnesium_polylepis.1
MRRKIAVYTAAEPMRPRGGSGRAWDCTQVITDHDFTRQSTRDLHHEPSWLPVRLNCAPLRSEKSADFRSGRSNEGSRVSLSP